MYHTYKQRVEVITLIEACQSYISLAYAFTPLQQSYLNTMNWLTKEYKRLI